MSYNLWRSVVNPSRSWLLREFSKMNFIESSMRSAHTGSPVGLRIDKVQPGLTPGRYAPQAPVSGIGLVPGCNILCKPTKTKSPNDCPFYDLIKHGLATEVQKAYIAGIVDGEGCITIMRRNTKRKSGIISFYQGLVTVTNTNKKMLDFIAKLYGGWITVNRKPKSSEQTSYNWVCTGNNMRRLLRDIIGYLIVKKKNAKIVLGFPIYEHVGGRSEKQKKEQENLWLLMKGLNHRGVSNAKKCFM